MKVIRLIGALLAFSTAATRGQDPALPTRERPDDLPVQSGSPVPTALPSPPPPLFPPDPIAPAERAASPAPAPPVLPGISELDQGFKEKPINAAAEAARRQSEWRILRNQVANDADVKTARRRAETAGTDFEKRMLLRDYYEIYFGKMIALTSDPGMKAFLNDRKREHLGLLPQPRVRPSPNAKDAER